MKVYDLSIPAAFHSQNQKIEIANLVQENRKNSVLNVDTNYSTSHTSTYSPAEQTKGFIESRRQKGADTLDVEQNLVAQEIATYNKKNLTQVRFGAINLITDKPLSSADLIWIK